MRHSLVQQKILECKIFFHHGETWVWNFYFHKLKMLVLDFFEKNTTFQNIFLNILPFLKSRLWSTLHTTEKSKITHTSVKERLCQEVRVGYLACLALYVGAYTFLWKYVNAKIHACFSYFWETHWGLESIFLKTSYVDLSNKKDQRSIGCLRRVHEFFKVGGMSRKSVNFFF